MKHLPVDPELHVLRTLARSLTGPGRTELESARFNLYAAISANDLDGARRWAGAVRVALLTLESDELRRLGLQALNAIEGGLDAKTPPDP